MPTPEPPPLPPLSPAPWPPPDAALGPAGATPAPRQPRRADPDAAPASPRASRQTPQPQAAQRQPRDGVSALALRASDCRDVCLGHLDNYTRVELAQTPTLAPNSDRTASEHRTSPPAPNSHRTARPARPPADAAAVRRRQDARRAVAYQLRHAIQAHSTLERFEHCGRVVVAPSGQAGIVLRGDRATWTGLATCGSVWVCPVCALKIQRERAAELRDVLEQHFAAGGGVVFATLTIPHRQRDALAHLLDIVSGGCTALRRARALRGVPWIRALEVTHGANGWHPHVHALLLLPTPPDAAVLALLERSIMATWTRDVFKRSGREVLPQLCRVLSVAPRDAAALAQYIAKLSYELTHSATKQAGGVGGATPMQLAADYAATGDAHLLALWREYEKATHKRRQLTWTVGLRITDDESAALEADADAPDAVVVAAIEPPLWAEIRRRPREAAHLLEIAERYGPTALRARLDDIRAAVAALSRWPAPMPPPELPPPYCGEAVAAA
jgi:hypothetical protein